MAKASHSKTVLQLIGILVLCLIVFTIGHKGYHDLAILYAACPDEFLRAFAQYALANIAGGGPVDCLD